MDSKSYASFGQPRSGTSDGDLNARAVSIFIVNRRQPIEHTDQQDAAFAFQVEMSVEVDRPLVPHPNPRGFDSEDWDERLADLHYRDVTEYAAGYNVSTSAEVAGGQCRRVRTEWMPQSAVGPTEPAQIDGVEFGMESLGLLADGATAMQMLSPLVTHYRDWIDGQSAGSHVLSGRRKEVANELVARARRAADRHPGWNKSARRSQHSGGFPYRQPLHGGIWASPPSS